MVTAPVKSQVGYNGVTREEVPRPDTVRSADQVVGDGAVDTISRENETPMARDSADTPPVRGGKTLDTGVRILWELRRYPEGRTHSEIARALEIDRTAVYRLLRALQAHHLVSRSDSGRYQLGLGLMELSAAVQPRLRAVADKELQALADECESTAFVTAIDGDEGVVVSVVEPAETTAYITYRVGIRHPLDRGAPGLAILAGRPHVQGERELVTQARSAGYAITSDELQVGATGVAVPIRTAEQPSQASVGIVGLQRERIEAAVPRVRTAADTIAASLQY